MSLTSKSTIVLALILLLLGALDMVDACNLCPNCQWNGGGCWIQGGCCGGGYACVQSYQCWSAWRWGGCGGWCWNRQNCNRGRCYWGWTGCSCDYGWGGQNCEKCADRFFSSSCRACTCQNGQCNDGLGGHGRCNYCYTGWSGQNCDSRCPTSANPQQWCSSHGICRWGVNQPTSYCDCYQNYYGYDCGKRVYTVDNTDSLVILYQGVNTDLPIYGPADGDVMEFVNVGRNAGDRGKCFRSAYRSPPMVVQNKAIAVRWSSFPLRVDGATVCDSNNPDNCDVYAVCRHTTAPYHISSLAPYDWQFSAGITVMFRGLTTINFRRNLQVAPQNPTQIVVYKGTTTQTLEVKGYSMLQLRTAEFAFRSPCNSYTTLNCRQNGWIRTCTTLVTEAAQQGGVIYPYRWSAPPPIEARYTHRFNLDLGHTGKPTPEPYNLCMAGSVPGKWIWTGVYFRVVEIQSVSLGENDPWWLRTPINDDFVLLAQTSGAPYYAPKVYVYGVGLFTAQYNQELRISLAERCTDKVEGIEGDDFMPIRRTPGGVYYFEFNPRLGTSGADAILTQVTEGYYKPRQICLNHNYQKVDNVEEGFYDFRGPANIEFRVARFVSWEGRADITEDGRLKSDQELYIMKDTNKAVQVYGRGIQPGYKLSLMPDGGSCTAAPPSTATSTPVVLRASYTLDDIGKTQNDAMVVFAYNDVEQRYRGSALPECIPEILSDTTIRCNITKLNGAYGRFNIHVTRDDIYEVLSLRDVGTYPIIFQTPLPTNVKYQYRGRLTLTSGGPQRVWSGVPVTMVTVTLRSKGRFAIGITSNHPKFVARQACDANIEWCMHFPGDANNPLEIFEKGVATDMNSAPIKAALITLADAYRTNTVDGVTCYIKMLGNFIFDVQYGCSTGFLQTASDKNRPDPTKIKYYPEVTLYTVGAPQEFSTHIAASENYKIFSTISTPVVNAVKGCQDTLQNVTRGCVDGTVITITGGFLLPTPADQAAVISFEKEYVTNPGTALPTCTVTLQTTSTILCTLGLNGATEGGFRLFVSYALTGPTQTSVNRDVYISLDPMITPVITYMTGCRERETATSIRACAHGDVLTIIGQGFSLLPNGNEIIFTAAGYAVSQGNAPVCTIESVSVAEIKCRLDVSNSQGPFKLQIQRNGPAISQDTGVLISTVFFPVVANITGCYQKAGIYIAACSLSGATITAQGNYFGNLQLTTLQFVSIPGASVGATPPTCTINSMNATYLVCTVATNGASGRWYFTIVVGGVYQSLERDNVAQMDPFVPQITALNGGCAAAMPLSMAQIRRSDCTNKLKLACSDPNDATCGMEITLIGTNFGEEASEGRVIFIPKSGYGTNLVPQCRKYVWSSTQIICTMGYNYNSVFGRFNIRVQRGDPVTQMSPSDVEISTMPTPTVTDVVGCAQRQSRALTWVMSCTNSVITVKGTSFSTGQLDNTTTIKMSSVWNTGASVPRCDIIPGTLTATQVQCNLNLNGATGTWAFRVCLVDADCNALQGPAGDGVITIEGEKPELLNITGCTGWQDGPYMTGCVGTNVITILGNRFGNDRNQLSVTVTPGGYSCPIDLNADRWLVCVLTGSDVPGVFSLTVTRGGTVSGNALTFINVYPPYITSISGCTSDVSPNIQQGCGSTQLTISGANFALNPTVSFQSAYGDTGDVPVCTIRAGNTPTNIVCDMNAFTGRWFVYVSTVNGKLITNSTKPFVIQHGSDPAPIVSNITACGKTKVRTARGCTSPMTITVYGTNFVPAVAYTTTTVNIILVPLNGSNSVCNTTTITGSYVQGNCFLSAGIPQYSVQLERQWTVTDPVNTSLITTYTKRVSQNDVIVARGNSPSVTRVNGCGQCVQELVCKDCSRATQLTITGTNFNTNPLPKVVFTKYNEATTTLPTCTVTNATSTTILCDFTGNSYIGTARLSVANSDVETSQDPALLWGEGEIPMVLAISASGANTQCRKQNNWGDTSEINMIDCNQASTLQFQGFDFGVNSLAENSIIFTPVPEEGPVGFPDRLPNCDINYISSTVVTCKLTYPVTAGGKYYVQIKRGYTLSPGLNFRVALDGPITDFIKGGCRQIVTTDLELADCRSDDIIQLSGNDIVQGGAGVKFVAIESSTPLPSCTAVSSDTKDANGRVIVTCPLKLPVDASGNVIRSRWRVYVTNYGFVDPDMMLIPPIINTNYFVPIISALNSPLCLRMSDKELIACQPNAIITILGSNFHSSSNVFLTSLPGTTGFVPECVMISALEYEFQCRLKFPAGFAGAFRVTITYQQRQSQEIDYTLSSMQIPVMGGLQNPDDAVIEGCLQDFSTTLAAGCDLRAVNTITIRGSNFATGASVIFRSVAASTGTPTCTQNIKAYPNMIVCDLILGGATGTWRVHVLSGTQETIATTYLVSSASVPPVITSMTGCADRPGTPDLLAQDSCGSNSIITFMGTNFGNILRTLEVRFQATASSTPSTPTCSIIEVTNEMITCRLSYSARVKGRFSTTIVRGGMTSTLTASLSTQSTPVVSSIVGCNQDVYQNLMTRDCPSGTVLTVCGNSLWSGDFSFKSLLFQPVPGESADYVSERPYCRAWRQLPPVTSGQQCVECTLEVPTAASGRYRVVLQVVTNVLTRSFDVDAVGDIYMNTRKEQPNPSITSVTGCNMTGFDSINEVRGCNVGDAITIKGSLFQASNYYEAPLTTKQTVATGRYNLCLSMPPLHYDFRHKIPRVTLTIVELKGIECPDPTSSSQPLTNGCWSTYLMNSANPFFLMRPRQVFLRGNGTDPGQTAFWGWLKVYQSGMKVAQRLMFRRDCSDTTPCGMYCGSEISLNNGSIQMISQYTGVPLFTANRNWNVCYAGYALTDRLWLNSVFVDTPWKVTLDGSIPVQNPKQGAALKILSVSPYDSRYTPYDKNLTLTWAGWDDPDTALREIQWAAGSSNVGEDRSVISGGWFSVRNSVNIDGSMRATNMDRYWSKGFFYNYQAKLIPDIIASNPQASAVGAMFISLRIWNHVGMYTVITSQPILIDRTPAVRGKVYSYNREFSRHRLYQSATNMHFQTSTNTIDLGFKDFLDLESHIYQFVVYMCYFDVPTYIGFDGVNTGPMFNTTRCNTTEVYKPMNPETAEIKHSFYDLLLRNGDDIYIVVDAYNGAGWRTNSSWWLRIDTTPPKYTVTLGDYGTYEIDNLYQFDNSSVTAYYNCTDPESGCLGASYWLSSTNLFENGDVVPKKDNEATINLVYADSRRIYYGPTDPNKPEGRLDLQHNKRYYIGITGTNNALLDTTGYSRSLLIDRTPPEAKLTQVVNVSYVDDRYQPSRDIIALKWLDWLDLESTIYGYYWTVRINNNYVLPKCNSPCNGQVPPAVPVGEKLQPTKYHYNPTQTNVSASFNNQLLDGQTYKLMMIGENGAHQRTAWERDIIVDGSPPEMDTTKVAVVGDTLMAANMSWVSTKYLRLNVDPYLFYDVHSNMYYYEYRVIRNRNVGRWTDDVKDTPWTNFNTSAYDIPIVLEHMEQYDVRLRGVNRAGLNTVYPTKMVVVADATPPSPPTCILDYDPRNTSYIGTYNGSTYIPNQRSATTPGKYAAQRKVIFSKYDDINYQDQATTLSAAFAPFVDDESGVYKTFFCVGYKDKTGNYPCSLVAIQETTETSLLVPLPLAPNITYYWTIFAVNKLGMLSSLSSNGVNIDLTPPTGGEIHDGPALFNDAFNHNTNELFGASWRNFVDYESDIHHYEWGIGTAKSFPNILPYTNVGLKSSASYNMKLYPQLTEGMQVFTFVRAYNGAGRYVEVVSNGCYLDIGLPTMEYIRELVRWGPRDRDYDFQNYTDQIEVVWRPLPSTIVESYDICLSTKKIFDTMHPLDHCDVVPIQTNISFGNNYTFKNLNLVHNKRYYVYLVSVNRVYSTNVSSNGMTVDLTAPTQGNVYDGLNAVDQWVQVDKGLTQVSWRNFADPESDIWYYELSIGTKPGSADWYGPRNVGQLKEYTIYAKFLHNNKYYATVRAVNSAWSSTYATSNGILVDATAPNCTFVADGTGTGLDYNNAIFQGDVTGRDLNFQNTTTISATWSCNDPETGIISYDWAIGTAPGLQDVMAMTNVTLATDASKAGLTLQEKRRYFVTIRAMNAAGTFKSEASNGVVYVVGSQPRIEFIRHGLGETDTLYQYQTTTMAANWFVYSPFVPLKSIEYAIGTTAQASTDVLSWSPIYDLKAETFTVQNLNLIHGTKYFFSLRVTNVMYEIQVNTSAGVFVDALPLTTGSVSLYLPAGLVRYPTTFFGDKINFHTSRNIIGVEWTMFKQTGPSGIQGYSVCMGSKMGTTDILPCTYAYLARKLLLNTETDGFLVPIVDGMKIYVTVEALAHSGLVTRAYAAPFVVDSSAPVARDVYADICVKNPTTLAVSWDTFSDVNINKTMGSGINFYSYCIGTSSGGCNVVNWKNTTDFGFQETGLNLIPGTKYYTTIRATDMAGNVGSYTTKGTCVDTSAPYLANVNTEATLLVTSISYPQTVELVVPHFYDDNSDICSYQAWIVRAMDETATKADYFNLQRSGKHTLVVHMAPSTTYRAKVRVENCAGIGVDILTNAVSQEPPSPGVVLDNDPVDTLRDDAESVDVDFQSSGSLFAASWSGFRDPFFTFKSYTWGIGTIKGTDNVVPFTTIGIKTRVKTNIAPKPALKAGTKVYVTVIATSTSGMNATQYSNGVTIDTTPCDARFSYIVVDNSIYVPDPVNSRYYINRTDSITLRIMNVTDELSPIRYRVAIGSRPEFGNYYTDAKPNPDYNRTISNLALSDGNVMYITAEAQNYAGLSCYVPQAIILVDSTPPIAPDTITDSDNLANDELFSTNATTMAVSWTPCVDLESGIEGTYLAVGTTVGGQETVPFMKLNVTKGKSTFRFVNKTFASNKYYLTIKCRNNAGLESSATTNGIIIDVVPPTQGSVHVGMMRESGPRVYHPLTSPNSTSAYWRGFRSVSGIRSYEMRLETMMPDNVTNTLSDWMNVGIVFESQFVFPQSVLPLQDGFLHRVHVRATSYVNTSSYATSRWILYESSPPTLGSITVPPAQMTPGTLTFNFFNFTEPHSVVKIEAAYGSSTGGIQLCAFTEIARGYPRQGTVTVNVTSVNETFSGVNPRWYGTVTFGDNNTIYGQITFVSTILNLQDQIRYYPTLRLTNLANQEIVAYGEGTIIYTSAPVVVGVPEISGTYYHTKSNWLRVSWESVFYGSLAKSYVITVKQQGQTLATASMRASATAPLLFPADGNVEYGEFITMRSDTKRATIYYTLDGSAPTPRSLVYDRPITLKSGKYTIRAIATHDLLLQSDESVQDFYVSNVNDVHLLETKPYRISANFTNTTAKFVLKLQGITAPTADRWAIAGSPTKCPGESEVGHQFDSGDATRADTEEGEVEAPGTYTICVKANGTTTYVPVTSIVVFDDEQVAIPATPVVTLTPSTVVLSEYKGNSLNLTNLTLASGSTIEVNIQAAGFNNEKVSVSATQEIDHTAPVIPKDMFVSPGLYASGQTVNIEWKPCTDAESAIQFYEVALGTCNGSVADTNSSRSTANATSCIDDIRPFQRVGLQTSTAAVFTDTAKANSSALIYVTIRCTNRAGLTAGTNYQFLLDNTPPTFNEDAFLSTISMTEPFYMSLDVPCYDMDSGLSHILYSIGSTPGGVQIMVRGLQVLNTPNTNTTTLEYASAPLVGLVPSSRYYVTARCVNKAGLTTIAQSSTVFVTTIAPTVVKNERIHVEPWGYVRATKIGTNAIVPVDAMGPEITFTYAQCFADAGGGIGGYIYRLWQPQTLWMKQDITTESTLTLTLEPGCYNLTVRARGKTSGTDADTKVISEEVVLDSLSCIDAAIPKPGRVNDGIAEDIDTIFSDVVFANWNDFQDDLFVGLEHYEWAVYKVPIGRPALSFPGPMEVGWRAFYNEFQGGNDTIIPFRSTGKSTKDFATNIKMESGWRYYTVVRAFDYVGLFVTAQSNGFVFTPNGPKLSGFYAQYNWTQPTTAKMFWNLPTDSAGKVKSCRVAVGTTPGGIQMRDYTSTNDFEKITFSGLTLRDGVWYYGTLICTNDAFLSSEAITPAFQADSTPPTGGKLNHVVGVQCVEHPHLANTSSLSACWSGFTDPHSGINRYYVRFVDDTNTPIVSIFVSNTTNTYTKHFKMPMASSRYTLSVTAYNGVNGTQVANKTVYIDNSPPDAGVVFDGLGVTTGAGYVEPDLQCQYSTSTIAANWKDFVDKDSGIRTYMWAAGSTPKGIDLVRFTDVGTQTSALATLSTPLQVGSRYYVTVRAINNVGLFTEVTSDGFVVLDGDTASGTACM
eukprot:PhF_6_TR38633/c0_g1_i1/m.57648